MRTHKAPQLVAAAMAVVLSSAGAAAACPWHDGDNTTYYISIGDSIAAGYQPDVNRDTDAAYSDQLYSQLKQYQPGLKHIRLGCDGETTESLVKGGTCSYPNAQSQLDAALKAMAQYKGKVAYVTVDVGANDILQCVDKVSGAFDQACVNRATQAIPQNVAQITQALRAAATPNTKLTGMTYYNPFLAQWLRGQGGQETAKASVSLINAENAALSQVYAGAGFQVADVAGAFGSNDFTPVDVPGYGQVPANVAKVCQLTWACTKQDPHPNASGHTVIAGAFAAVLRQG